MVDIDDCTGLVKQITPNQPGFITFILCYLGLDQVDSYSSLPCSPLHSRDIQSKQYHMPNLSLCPMTSCQLSLDHWQIELSGSKSNPSLLTLSLLVLTILITQTSLYFLTVKQILCYLLGTCNRGIILNTITKNT